MTRIGWLEKWTLRFAVVGLLFLALAIVEGALMRTQLVNPASLEGFEGVLNRVRVITADLPPATSFYAMLTAHPIVGIYGFAYMLVMGAFYFLVPYVLRKEIRYKSLVPVNFWAQTVGVLGAWAAGFFVLFNALYTLYWPLPVAYDRVPLIGSIIFGAGLVLVEINVLLFVFNIFATVLSRTNPHPEPFWRSLLAAVGVLRLGGRKGRNPGARGQELPVFIVAVGRGSVDTAINAIVMFTAGLLLLFYGLPALRGVSVNPGAINALYYKNWFWWGLDMIADGNVLMYTAGTWYLLVPLLVGRRLYGESVVRTVILADLLVSLFVWSHHLLGDRPQPFGLRLLSGQMVTWGEFITMGLTMFSVLMTIWLARPVALTVPLKFVLGSVFGFVVGGMAGLTQANVGLNLVLHNTQWVIGIHAHTMILAGLSMLLFAVVYALIPMLTNLQIRSTRLADVHFWTWMVGSLLMTYAMGMAGSRGMLRRMLYEDGLYQPYMMVALIGGLLVAVAFVIFLANVIWTLGWRNVLGLFVSEGRAAARPAQAGA